MAGARVEEQTSDIGSQHDSFSSLMESLLQIATRRNRHDVLSSFCAKYLAYFFSEQVAINASAESMFDILAGAVDIRKDLHDMERRMDKVHFTELLTGGYFMYGGIDKQTSRPIAWTRTGLAESLSKHTEVGGWRYRAGSPKALAFIR